MNIAIANALLPSEEQSGVPYQVHRLANSLVDRKHAVTVFSFSPKPSDARYEVQRLPRVGNLRKLDPFFFAYRLAKVDFSTFDMLNVHGDSFLLWKSPHVRTFHGSAAEEARAASTLRRRFFFTVINVLERIGARISARNICVSEANRFRFETETTVIPCGVDTQSFTPGRKTQCPTILFVGTTLGRKRGSWFAELFSRDVLPQIPNAELLMVSDKEVDLPGVRNLGRVSDERLAELYRSSWLFCLPSTYEGFGVPYIEAMASGTAVVASPNPGAREVLGDGRFGALASDRELAATIVGLLAGDARREESERAGLSRSSEYRWTNVAIRYEDVFTTLLGRAAERGESHPYDRELV